MVTESPEIQDELEEVLNEEHQEETNEGNQEAEQPQEKKRNRVPAGRRIGQMRREIGDRDRLLEEKDRELAELKANQPGRNLAAPEPDNFATHAEYLAEQDKYINEQADIRAKNQIDEENAAAKQKLQDDARAEENAKIAKAWAKKKAKAVKKYEGYADLEQEFVEDVKDLGILDVLDDIGDCVNGPDIVYYLKETNPDELEKIASLGQRARSRAIGKIEARLTSTKTTEKQLPPPNRIVKGSGSFSEKSRRKETYAERCKRINGM